MRSKNLILPSATELALEKIQQLRLDNLRKNNTQEIREERICALVYIVKYLEKVHHLTIDQIKQLDIVCLNAVPKIILSQQRSYILTGLIPIYGWYVLVKYIAFKKRIEYLNRLGDNGLFDKNDNDKDIKYILDITVERCHPVVCFD